MNSNSNTYSVLVNLIYARSKIGILATVVNVSILVFILWEEIPHWILALWYIITLLVAFIRYILNQRFLRRADPSQDIRRWGQLLKVGLAISGLLWGAAGIFLFPIHSVAHQVFIVFAIAGMVAGAVGVFSPIMTAFLAFSIPALVPIAIRFILIGDQLHMAMGAMITLFATLTFITAQQTGISTRELIELKETFADRLKERTADLERVNSQLKGEIAQRTQAQQERERLIVELQDTIGKVRTLSGLLPICSSCKKIRDDQGYWNQIERYISKHSTAEFTHGICPECAQKLYPDLDV
jgi:two-component system cell cycle sensor histidine kinase/response regulator CckA